MKRNKPKKKDKSVILARLILLVGICITILLGAIVLYDAPRTVPSISLGSPVNLLVPIGFLALICFLVLYMIKYFCFAPPQ